MVQAPRSRKHRIEAAINHALDRRWDLAAEANRALLEEDATDVESANRLGKALTELGDTRGAIEAYERALAIDSANAIARKNLARLQAQGTPARRTRTSKTKAGGAPPAGGRHEARTTAMIGELGKSADLRLQRVNAEAADGVSAGDPAQLELTPGGLAVQTEDGATLGFVEPRIAARLRRMIEGGNRYAVVVRRAEADGVVVHVRETYMHPSLVGQASFLPLATDRRRVAPRAYTKASVLQYGRDSVETDDDEEDEWSGRGSASTEDSEENIDLDDGDADEDLADLDDDASALGELGEDADEDEADDEFDEDD